MMKKAGLVVAMATALVAGSLVTGCAGTGCGTGGCCGKPCPSCKGMSSCKGQDGCATGSCGSSKS